MRILLAGASGLIGSALVQRLRVDGHRLTRLVRRSVRDADELRWDGTRLDPRHLAGVDAVIDLAGASIGRIPWTTEYRRTLVSSRVEPTVALAEAIVAAETPPSVFLNASAVGFYGDRPGEELTEDAARGDGFLPDLVLAWEQAAGIASGVSRVVTLRTSVVIARGGGMAPVQLLTRFGLGARMGSGAQFWPWISLHDEVSAIAHLLTSSLTGPVNLAGPEPATSDRITRAFATMSGKPYLLRVPEFAIGALGEAGQRLLLDDMRAVPAKLAADGFGWRHATVEAAIAAI